MGIRLMALVFLFDIQGVNPQCISQPVLEAVQIECRPLSEMTYSRDNYALVLRTSCEQHGRGTVNAGLLQTTD